MTDCPSRFSLLAWRAGDMADNEQQRLRQHLAGCARCRAERDRIDGDVAAYDREGSRHLRTLRHALSHEAGPRPSPRRALHMKPFAGLAAAAALAAAMVLILRPAAESTVAGPVTPVRPATNPPPTANTAPVGTEARRQHTKPAAQQPPSGANGSRQKPSYKGAFGSKISVVRAGHAFSLAPDTQLRPDDILRFSVQVQRPGYVAVFSIDARGRLAHHYPDSPPEKQPTPLKIEGRGLRMLDGGVVLDSEPGIECWVVAFSPQPFDRAQLATQVKAAPWYKKRSPPTTTRIGSAWVQARFLHKAG